MCPDPVMLINYSDNLLSKEHRKIIDAHFTICSTCMNNISKITSSQIFFKNTSALDKHQLYTAEQNVWKKIQKHKSSGKNFLSLKLKLPLPIATAAAVLFVIIAVLFVGTGGNDPDFPIPAVVKYTEQDLEEVKNYIYNTSNSIISEEASFNLSQTELEQLAVLLSEKSAVMEIKITLPSESSFDIHGAPEFIDSLEFRRNKNE